MRGFETAIKQDMELEKRMITLIRQEMKKLPSGRLKQGASGRSVYENQTHSIPPNGERARGIARRNLLEFKLKIIEENLRAQEELRKRYRSYRDDRVLALLKPVYQNILKKAWSEIAQQRQAARIAAQQQAIASGRAHHAEHLKHKNMKGEINRSKSEVIVGNVYDSLKIPYSYEERIYWPQDAPPEAWAIKRQLNIPDYYVPDFTCILPDGTKKYHEHLGKMDDEEYMETWKKKMILYYWAGVIPGKNLIITADDRYGGIDQQEIMQILLSELGELVGMGK
ncbi:MAG: hypothetical protein IKT31_02040 [Firmicutes bacterium]|nr:hypothetical protein [Bacillota bacterium]